MIPLPHSMKCKISERVPGLVENPYVRITCFFDSSDDKPVASMQYYCKFPSLIGNPFKIMLIAIGKNLYVHLVLSLALWHGTKNIRYISLGHPHTCTIFIVQLA